jgi:hypothetical protein
MTVGSACEVAQRQTPGLGVAVPYAVTSVLLTMLGPRNIGLTFAGKTHLTAKRGKARRKTHRLDASSRRTAILRPSCLASLQAPLSLNG